MDRGLDPPEGARDAAAPLTSGRTAKSQRTRHQLLVAAREVFERDGFLQARVTDIASTAGASHGSFYRYFSSKTDIFRALVNEAMDALYTSVGARPSEVRLAPADRIRRSNRQFYETYRANTALLALFEHVATFDDEVRQLRLRVRERAVGRAASSIRRMQDSGQVTTDLDAYCTATVLVSMTNSTLHYWLALGGHAEGDELLRTLDQVWLRTLGLPTNGAASA